MSSGCGQFFVDFGRVHSPPSPGKSRAWRWGGTYPPPPRAVPHHDGMWPHLLATSGHLCSRHRCPRLSGRCLIWQVGLSWGGHGVGTQSLGGHMASLPWGEPVPMRSHGTVAPTCPAVTRGCVRASEPTEQGLRHNAVPCNGSPLGRHTFFWPTQRLRVLEAGWSKDSGKGLSWGRPDLQACATQHIRLARSWVWWPPERWGGGGRRSTPTGPTSLVMWDKVPGAQQCPQKSQPPHAVGQVGAGRRHWPRMGEDWEVSSVAPRPWRQEGADHGLGRCWVVVPVPWGRGSFRARPEFARVSGPSRCQGALWPMQLCPH